MSKSWLVISLGSCLKNWNIIKEVLESTSNRLRNKNEIVKRENSEKWS